MQAFPLHMASHCVNVHSVTEHTETEREDGWMSMVCVCVSVHWNPVQSVV